MTERVERGTGVEGTRQQAKESGQGASEHVDTEAFNVRQAKQIQVSCVTRK